jgi:two-component system response regulator MprA
MTGRHRILVVEDDHGLRDRLVRGLRAQDFDVLTASDGATALASLDPVPDAVILDIGLPDSDGRDVCQAMRSRGVDAPVIFLSSRQSVSDRLSGFASGGDDYLAKPFVLAELVARLRAVLRRHVQALAEAHPRDLHLDLMSHSVQWLDRRVELSPTEFRLLARLLAEPHAVVRRRQLRESAWPAGAVVADNTLDQYMTKLRRKLAALGAPHVLRAARGVGYQLVAPNRSAQGAGGQPPSG